MEYLLSKAFLILQCIQDHFNDICADSFWASLTCAAGCKACPECCLGAAIVFGVGCAIELSEPAAAPSISGLQSELNNFTD